MNERIEALKKLATKEVWGNNPHNGSPEFDGYELDADMFAELIVRECAEQIKTQGISAYGDYEMGFNAGLYHALYTTKQHFGVEE